MYCIIGKIDSKFIQLSNKEFTIEEARTYRENEQIALDVKIVQSHLVERAIEINNQLVK